MKRIRPVAIAFFSVFGLLIAMILSGCDLISLDMGNNSNDRNNSSGRNNSSNSSDSSDSSNGSEDADSPQQSSSGNVANITYVIPDVYIPTAPGIAVEENGQALVDFSNMQDGYIMAKYTEATDMKVKLLITVPAGTQYTYSLHPGMDFQAFPLSGHNGAYEIGVFKQVEGDRYSAVLSTTINVTLVDEFAPFLRPNQFVDFNQDSEVVRKAAQLTAGIDDFLEKVAAIYHFVISNITYDVELAETVQVGYVPNVDLVLERGMGICFDYASLMSAMLRSQGIPTKLVIGYTGEQYHAWISVFCEENGWLDDIIYFDGENWSLVDPTFAASIGTVNLSEYIGDGSNYTEKFLH